MYIELVLAIILILLVLGYFQKRGSRFPTGPWGLPVVGNLVGIQLAGGPHLAFQKWAKEFGPLFSIKMGTNNVFVISDPKLMKDFFSKNSTSGRLRNPVFTSYSENYGIAVSDGANWEAQRRFFIKTLKDFGFRKGSVLENLILEEAAGVLNYFEKNMGKPIPVADVFIQPVVNTLWGLVSRDRDESDVAESSIIIQKANDFMVAFNKVIDSGVSFMPSLRLIVPGASGWTAYINSIHAFQAVITNRIDKHASRLDTNEPRDFIDHFLVEMKGADGDPSSSFYKDIGRKNLIGVLMDVMAAGSDTSDKAMEWAMLYLSYFKEIQRLVQKELDEVIGDTRLPSLSDRARVPYTEAVILEVLRFSSHVVMSLPHRLMEDVEFQGYLLPKESTVLGNFFTINHSESVWGNDVGEFRPTRFLNEDGTKVIRNEALTPFSIGKRQCIGESMAMDTLFLFVSSIFLKFNVDLDPSQGKPDLNGNSGLILTTQPFKVVISHRKQGSV